MNKRQFVQQRREDWRRFEELVDHFDRRSLRKLKAKDISEFSRLFRALSNDLAIIRSRTWGGGLVSYLNHLVARGHNVFYTAPPQNLSRTVQFVTTGFPRLFRANIGYFLVAAALFFAPLGISWAVIQNDPTLASRILPSEALEEYEGMYGEDVVDPDVDEEEQGVSFEEERSTMFGFYIYNNVGIAFQCFARGVLLGVGTVYTLLYNGIAIGAISGYVISLGYSDRFLSFVVSHGSFELTAIAVAGGAGLMLGNAIIHPGRRRRVEALQVRALEAVQIAGGAGVMLTVAALIEAFWSPSPVAPILKYTVGGILWLLVVLYLALAGRRG